MGSSSKNVLHFGPARELLASNSVPMVWGAFDAAWYVRAYPEATAPLAGAENSEVLRFYLQEGQSLGHSPNIFFDELWYLQRYPDVCELVRQGVFRSGFDHYCAEGFSDRSPHWLFDHAWYSKLCGNPTIESLRRRGFFDLYDEYLRHGARLGRPCHTLFDPNFFANHNQLGDEEAINPFGAFLLRLHRRVGEPQCSLYFDPRWYRQTYPDADRAISDGRYLGALHHYLCNGSPEAFDPHPLFSERYYLAQNPDVKDAIRERKFQTGYLHFLNHGVFELRAPSPLCDLQTYWNNSAAARRAVHNGQTREIFTYLLEHATAHELVTLPDIDETKAQADFLRRAEIFAASLRPNELNFAYTEEPHISVIVVAHNRFALTVQALASLRTNYAGPIQLVFVDSGSTDETRFIERYIHGACILRFAENIGFVRAVNTALREVLAPVTLFMNNDITLAPMAIARGLYRLDKDPTVGAVGAKTLRTHGRLQEAGSIIWRDGSVSGYLRDAPATAPEANFLREVDFASGTFLFVRTEALRRIGGFDERFSPAYYEDVDFCFRLQEAGWRVVYDPAVMITHFEHASSRSAADAARRMEEKRKVFQIKHQARLRRKHAPRPELAVFARRARPSRWRVLFLEDVLPLPWLGSGYGRSNDIVRALAEIGAEVTIFPVNPTRVPLARIYSALPETVEIMHDRTIDDLEDLFADRRGFYNIVWVSRAHNLAKALPTLEAHCADVSAVSVILDTEAVFSLREAAKAKLHGQPFDLEASLAEEFKAAWFCQFILAVNEAEAECLRRFGFSDVDVLGTTKEANPTTKRFEDRSGFLFVGSIHATDSPNYDGLVWLTREVLPLVARALTETVEFAIAGYLAPGVDLAAFASVPGVRLLGEVENLTPLYERYRVFVAPTRYAAGTPYKVYEAAAHGLPIAATPLLATQLGWCDGVELRVGSSTKEFARAMLALYRSKTEWTKIRNAALSRIRREHSASTYRKRIRDILEKLRPSAARK